MYTVEDAVDKMGFGLFQVLLSSFAGLIWVRVSPQDVPHAQMSGDIQKSLTFMYVCDQMSTTSSILKKFCVPLLSIVW